MKISKEMEARIRVMYAMDLATRWGSAKSTMRSLFEDGINPEWIKHKDVFRNLSERDLKNETLGCFKIRRTKKSYIIYTDICRIPIDDANCVQAKESVK